METVHQRLTAGRGENGSTCIDLLRGLINDAQADPSAVDPSTWSLALDSVCDADFTDDFDYKVYYAVVLLIRNMLQVKQPGFERIFGAFERYLEHAKPNDHDAQIVNGYLQAMVHLSYVHGSPEYLRAADRACGARNTVQLHPILLLLANDTIPDFKLVHLNEFLRQKFIDHDFEQSTGLEQRWFAYLMRFISNEKFPNYISELSERTLAWYQLAQVLVPAVSTVDTDELMGLLSWTVDAAKDRFPAAVAQIPTNAVSEIDEKIVTVLLDIISELCAYEVYRNGLVSYKFMDVLIPLFGTVHQYYKPINLKDKEAGKTARFPHVKSICLEIIAHLVQKNKPVQDRVRELGGLQPILSSCVIDANNPYMKERAVMCIKFLLEGNPDNQAVVANLEKQELERIVEEKGPLLMEESA